MKAKACHSTYLQAFYFSLESKDEIFHITTVKAILTLFFRGLGALCTWFLIMDCGRQRQSWKPLLRQCDWLFLLGTSELVVNFIRVAIISIIRVLSCSLWLHLLIIDHDYWSLDVLLRDANDARSHSIGWSTRAASCSTDGGPTCFTWYDDGVLGQIDRCQADSFRAGDYRWTEHLGHRLRDCHHVGRATSNSTSRLMILRMVKVMMVMMSWHTHRRFGDLTHSKLLEDLLLGRTWHCHSSCRPCHLWSLVCLLIILTIAAGDLLFLYGCDLFHSCRCQRFCLQCLTLI